MVSTLKLMIPKSISFSLYSGILAPYHRFGSYNVSVVCYISIASQNPQADGSNFMNAILNCLAVIHYSCQVNSAFPSFQPLLANSLAHRSLYYVSHTSTNTLEPLYSSICLPVQYGMWRVWMNESVKETCSRLCEPPSITWTLMHINASKYSCTQTHTHRHRKAS